MKQIIKKLLPMLLLLGRPALIAVLHETFRSKPELKSIFTEALLSFEGEKDAEP